jgi:ferredoxin--NADP+ reductase
LIDDGEGKVAAIRIVKNKLVRTDSGGSRPKPTDQVEELPVGLVFAAVGYRGVPLLGVPYREDWGTIPNVKGRVVTDPESERLVVGEYVTGWIKRGPTGVIGTNKADSVETVECMLEDLKRGLYLAPSKPEAAAVDGMFSNCKPTRFSWGDWQIVDGVETTRGEKQGRPRVKFTSVEDMLDVRDDS